LSNASPPGEANHNASEKCQLPYQMPAIQEKQSDMPANNDSYISNASEPGEASHNASKSW
jgi:hypothetical protein